MTLSGETLRVKLECVRIQNVIAPEVEHRAMEIFCTTLDDRVNRAATSAPILDVVSVRHNFKFLHRVHVWCNFPLAGVCTGLLSDWGAVQSELVIKT